MGLKDQTDVNIFHISFQFRGVHADRTGLDSMINYNNYITKDSEFTNWEIDSKFPMEVCSLSHLPLTLSVNKNTKENQIDSIFFIDNIFMSKNVCQELPLFSFSICPADESNSLLTTLSMEAGT